MTFASPLDKQSYERSYSNMRRSALAMLKLEKGCADCGYDTDPAALDFDHVRGVKSDHVSKLRHMGWQRLFDEIDKCEVVCANCHRVRTAERKRSAY